MRLCARYLFNVLSFASTAISQQKQELSDRFKDYLIQAEATEIQEDHLSAKLEQLLIESGVTTTGLIYFLSDWQELDWHVWLQQRQDLESNKIEQTVEQLVKIGDRLQAKVKDWQVQITAASEELQHKLESYLRYTNLDHLTPDKTVTKLEQLGQKTKTALPQMWQQLPTIDVTAALEILSRRKGVKQEQIEVIIEQITTNWQQLTKVTTPELQLEEKSTELSEKLVDDLYQAIAKNLDRAETKVDLSPLLDLAKGKTRTIVNQQLARVGWHELETRLKQVQHGSEQQIKLRIKQAREAAHKLIRMPRRWATRTSHQAQDLVESLKDFLSHGNKLEFDAKNLENNLKSIFHQSKTSIKSDATSNQHDLTKLSLVSISQLLEQRPDLTPVETQQISDRTLETIEQLATETKTQQIESNQVLQDLFNGLGDYFSSLDLWHVHYADLKESLADYDFQSLTDDWQKVIADTPLSEIGDRLEELSQESIAKISETNELFRNSSLTQIQQIQDYLNQQIETIKLTAQERTANFKQQTLQQVEATIKAIAELAEGIAVAAYWLFAITFTSAVASAVAGFLATQHNL